MPLFDHAGAASDYEFDGVEQDRLLPPDGCAALGELIPGARVVRLAAGHGVIGQCIAEVNDALLSHLAASAPALAQRG